jgi:hypothetical protein
MVMSLSLRPRLNGSCASSRRRVKLAVGFGFLPRHAEPSKTNLEEFPADLDLVEQYGREIKTNLFLLRKLKNRRWALAAALAIGIFVGFALGQSPDGGNIIHNIRTATVTLDR